MQDALTKLRSSYAYKTFDNAGTVTANSASAAITDAAGNTGYVQIKNTSRVPHRGMFLDILMPGVSGNGGITTTGGPTAVAITFTVTFSDDGSTQAGPTVTSKAVSVTITSNAGTAPGELFLALPRVNHGYIKVAWATSFTGGSTPTAAWGLLDIALVQGANTGIATDIG